MHSLDFNARLRSLLQITAEQPCPTDNALHLQNRAPRALWIQNAMQLSLRSSLKPKVRLQSVVSYLGQLDPCIRQAQHASAKKP